MSMSNRDRVKAALSREETDRCPMQIAFTPEFAERLHADMNAKSSGIHNPHGGGNTHELELALDQDMLLSSLGWANNYYQEVVPNKEYKDIWGIGWRAVEYQTKFGNGVYTEMIEHPLADDKAVDDYVAPDIENPELYKPTRELIDTYGDQYWIVGVTVTTIWETAWALRGYERMLMDLALNPALADKILDIPYNFHLTAAKKLVEMGVDMIWMGDDVGGQNAMIISPDQWRQLLKPRMASFIGALKEINPDVKVAYHSDGNILPIIPDLIEVGLDVLNPIQPACMDPAKIKEEFGKDLCFWGTVDEQFTLPFGTPDDVRNEVKTRLETVGKGGGLIIGPTHHVQLDTPMENFWAMVETIKGEK